MKQLEQNVFTIISCLFPVAYIDHLVSSDISISRGLYFIFVRLAYNIIFWVAKFDMITVVGVVMLMLSVFLFDN